VECSEIHKKVTKIHADVGAIHRPIHDVVREPHPQFLCIGGDMYCIHVMYGEEDGLCEARLSSWTPDFKTEQS